MQHTDIFDEALVLMIRAVDISRAPVWWPWRRQVWLQNKDILPATNVVDVFVEAPAYP